MSASRIRYWSELRAESQLARCVLHQNAPIPKIGVEEVNKINTMETPSVLGFSASAHKLFISVSRYEVTCITEGAFSENHISRVIEYRF